MITAVVPSVLFPQPIFVYSMNNYLILNTIRDDNMYGDLLHYFYVSKEDRYNKSQAVHMVLQAQDKFTYVTKLLPSPSTETTDYSFFVKKFVIFQGTLPQGDVICHWCNLTTNVMFGWRHKRWRHCLKGSYFCQSCFLAWSWTCNKSAFVLSRRRKILCGQRYFIVTFAQKCEYWKKRVAWLAALKFLPRKK